jgi:hypothetical protein
LFVGAEKRLGSLRALPKDPSPPEKKKPKKKTQKTFGNVQDIIWHHPKEEVLPTSCE